MATDFHWRCPDCGTELFFEDLEIITQCAACGACISAAELRDNIIPDRPGEKVVCIECGCRIFPGVEFCPECGAVVDARTSSSSGFSQDNTWVHVQNFTESTIPNIRLHSSRFPLHRLEKGKVVGGVCAGVAQKFKCSVGILRLGLSLTSCFGLLPYTVAIYLILWVVLPKRDN